MIFFEEGIISIWSKVFKGPLKDLMRGVSEPGQFFL
jgi:hypothetical protein